MNFDPTDVTAVKQLARKHCKELLDAPLTESGVMSATLDAEKYLSNDYLDSLDSETRETFLSVYDAESKLFYKELTEKDEIAHRKVMDEMRANYEVGLARIARMRSRFKVLVFVAVVIAISVVIIRNL